LWARHEPVEAHHAPEQVTLAERSEARGT
jgi:hypothetical protein